MNGNEASDWAEEFKGKDLAYFKDYNPPPLLSTRQRAAYLAAWDSAKAIVEKELSKAELAARAREAAAFADANADPDGADFEDDASDAEPWDRDLDEAPSPTPLALSPSDAPLEAEIIPPMPPLVRPTGDAAQLLEHQLGTCAALIGGIADYIMRASSDPDVCLNFMDRITSMMRSSASAGKVVGRLRGAAPEETRHRVIVEHAIPQPGQGEGVLRA